MLPLVATLVAASALRIYLIARDSVPFVYDMGRDLLWAKDIVFYQKATLIGPAASIWGVYFGPLWFYFLSVPLLITGGHPLSAVYATMATVLLTGILSFLLFRKILGNFFSLILAILILFGSTLINISTFAFHANILPLLTLLMIYFCYLAVVKKPIFIVWAFLITSLMFHADPAPAVVSTLIPFSTLVIFKLYKSKNFPKTALYLAIAFLVPFIPQVLFEIRNGFIQTKSLVAYFLGQNPSLSGQLPLLARVENRVDIFFDFFKNSVSGGNQLLAALLISAIGLGIYFFVKKVKDENLKILLYLSLLSILIYLAIFAVIFTPEVKEWYLYGTPPLFAIMTTLALYLLQKYKWLIAILLAIFVFFNISPLMSQTRRAAAARDPANLRNQLAVVNLIYDDSPQEFSVYVFTPAIYDLNYQYLFWWQGTREDKGLPQDFAYLPNQPDYVRHKNFYTTSGAEISDTVYLIIENAPENEFYTKAQWLKNFDNYQVVWQKDIRSAITIQKRLR